MTGTARELELQFFQNLNAAVEPWIKAGLGSPGLLPVGLVVVETIGRKSHTPRRTPLAGVLFEERLIVSTVRGTRSQWVRNALATPEVRYWLAGNEQLGTALVLATGLDQPPDSYSPLFTRLLRGPLAAAVALDWAFAIITPLNADPFSN
ncbi:MAG: nitroreductase/quinone reductase family protein [Tepidiformaceae bacterium]